jgi:RNA polymerase sigma-70 factor, ECF subfamily
VNSHCGPGRPDVEAVWRDFRGPMLSFIGRRVSDRDTAEDILQDVMLRIHRHAAELTEVSSVGGWIHQITRNAIIDHYRRAVVRRELPVGVGSKLEPPAEPERVPDDVGAELAACLEPLLAQLPAIYREALQLTDLDGLTQAAAATRIGLTTSGMKARVQRGRGQLKALLTDCCEVALDRRGRVIEYRPQTDDCNCQSSTAKPGKQRAERPAGIRDAGSG